MNDNLGILKEVGTICASHGGTALSEILGKRINIELPSISFTNEEFLLKEFNKPKLVTGVCSRLLSGLKGNILFILDEKSALQMIEISYKSPEAQVKSSALTEMAISILKETGHVVISSFIGAIGLVMKKLIITSVPTLINGSLQEIINMTMSSCKTERNAIVTIEAVFDEPSNKISGSFYLFLDPVSAKEIQGICEKCIS